MEESSRELYPSAGHYIFTCGIVMLLWLLLGGSLQQEEIIAAFIVGVIVTGLMSPRMSLMAGVRLSFWAPVALLQYFGLYH
jgi:multisubunit Na+/H+ antiporter MnhE subunit